MVRDKVGHYLGKNGRHLSHRCSFMNFVFAQVAMSRQLSLFRSLAGQPTSGAPTFSFFSPTRHTLLESFGPTRIQLPTPPFHNVRLNPSTSHGPNKIMHHTCLRLLPHPSTLPIISSQSHTNGGCTTISGYEDRPSITLDWTRSQMDVYVP